jgi:hypothetical protein
MNIGIVTEYFFSEGKFHFPENALHFLDHAKDQHEVYVISSLERQPVTDHIKAVNVRTGNKEEISIAELNALYFGKIGKRIISYDQVNCLGNQLKEFCTLLEKLTPFEQRENGGTIRFSNPSETMIANLSKEYILELSETGLPFIPTTRVRTLAELEDLSRSRTKTIVKPLIAERAQGTTILNRLNPEEIKEYAKKYLQSEEENGSSLYQQLMARQGIIAQEYRPEFGERGEVKIAVIKGEIGLTRIVQGPGQEIVTPSIGASNSTYQPTKEERDIALEAFHQFNARYPVDFMRVDLVGHPGKVMINELEAINPNFGEDSTQYNAGEIKRQQELFLKYLTEPQYS